MRVFLRNLFVLGLVAVSAATVVASKPVFWQTATLNDFLRGEVENLSVDGHGRLVLGPATELVAETTSPFLWAMVVDQDGSIYVGSGNEGKVFKIDAGGKVATFFDTTELEVHALALARDGSLFAATSPDGRIYKIDRAGKGVPFFDPEDKYIWSLALDGQGNLYAGTGEKGLVYKITPDGKGTTFYSTKATHVIALAFERNGQLLAGTEGPGRLFRVDSSGKAFLLLDSTHQEIRAIRLDPQGNIYLAALTGRTTSTSQPPVSPPADAPPPPTREPVPTVTTEVTAIAVVDTGAASVGSADAPAREDRRGGRGAIYRIKPDGLWDILWESAEDSPYDLTLDAGGALIVGTGRNGKLYSLSGDPTTATLLMQASAQQVTGFARDSKGNVIYATSNPGKVFRLSPQRAAEGTYTSLVRDAQTVADWGTLSWRASVPAGGRVDVFTRSGNTATPDDTWSAWSGPYVELERGRNQKPERAVSAMEGCPCGQTGDAGAHIGLRGVRAAESAAEGDEPDGSSRGHGVSEAVPDRRSRHRRLRRSGTGPPHPERDGESRHHELTPRTARLSARPANVRVAGRRRERRRTAL